jgi:hypothetical protein
VNEDKKAIGTFYVQPLEIYGRHKAGADTSDVYQIFALIVANDQPIYLSPDVNSGGEWGCRRRRR